MDKRYQVFISSTYSDLKDERQAVIQTLMEMDCIPAGMELFPATDEEQWIFIKRVIDDCDYYILIIGGRYGTVAESGLSYTEMEFDYAIEKGIKVIALVHKDDSALPFSKVEASSESREKLLAFRSRVCTGRLVKFWEKPSELPGLVALSLQKTIKMYPALGWVRGGQAASTEVLSQINELRVENEKLKSELTAERKSKEVPPQGIAGGNDNFTISVRLSSRLNGVISRTNSSLNETWDGIFSMIGSIVLSPKGDALVKSEFQSSLREKHCIIKAVEVSHQSMNTIREQLSALNLIEVFSDNTAQGGQAMFWNITARGKQYLAELLVIKKKQ